jgi:hypothetical protein
MLAAERGPRAPRAAGRRGGIVSAWSHPLGDGHPE